MTIKVGINGMGRIGRMIVRSIYENYKGKIIIKHINNRSSSEICANLLKYDSIHGNFSSLVKSCLLYTSPSPRDRQKCRMPSSA